jgi:predicted PurR-regulated permease PerM
MSTSKTSNPFFLAAALVVIIAGVIYAQSLVTSVLLALFISIICAQPMFWLQRKGFPQVGAIILVFLGILALSFGLGEVIGRSLSSFSKQVPLYEQNINEIERTVLQFLTDMGMQISKEELTGKFDPSKLMGMTAGILGQLGSFLGNAFTIIFLVLFLLLELDSFHVKVRAIFGEKSTSLSYFNTIADNIRHYLTIKTLTSLLTGIIVWILLAVIGLDYAILWGLIAFLLNFIPNIGSFMAAVPAVLFAIIQLSFGGVIGTIVVFLGANLLIGNFVEPRLMGKGLGLSTFVVFFSLIFWGFVLGTVGMFLSVPLTIAIKIILEHNPSTRGFAIALGTQEEAQQILDSSDNDRN